MKGDELLQVMLKSLPESFALFRTSNLLSTTTTTPESLKTAILLHQVSLNNQSSISLANSLQSRGGRTSLRGGRRGGFHGGGRNSSDSKKNRLENKLIVFLALLLAQPVPSKIVLLFTTAREKVINLLIAICPSILNYNSILDPYVLLRLKHLLENLLL